MNPRFFEIENEIDSHLQAILNLRTEKRTIIQESLPEIIEVQIYFDDIRRIIRWNEGNLRLTKKQYLFVKTLWTCKNHKASLDEIDEQVWQAGTEHLPFSKRHTIFTLVRRAQNKLQKYAFPYKIKPIKNFSTQEIAGYKLVCARQN